MDYRKYHFGQKKKKLTLSPFSKIDTFTSQEFRLVKRHTGLLDNVTVKWFHKVGKPLVRLIKFILVNFTKSSLH